MNPITFRDFFANEQANEITPAKPEVCKIAAVAFATHLHRNLSKPKSRLLAFVIKELKELLPPTVFFAMSFNLIVLTTQLILADYLVYLWNFMIATTAALVVGKSVLVADALPFCRRFDTAPVIESVLFKTIIYWTVVFLVRFLEKLVEYEFGGGGPSAGSPSTWWFTSPGTGLPLSRSGSSFCS
jgi:hypothetical protein